MPYLKTCRLNFVGVLVQVHVSQHHHARQQQRRGVGEVPPRDVRRGPVNSFEDGAVRADVAAGREAEAADEAGAEVGEDVAVEVGHDEDVVLAGVLHHVEADRVQVALLEPDPGMLLRGLAAALQEESVTHPHDVCFVYSGNLAEYWN